MRPGHPTRRQDLPAAGPALAGNGRAAFTLIELPFDRLRVVSKREGKAFTLIELLVVIAIISLLVGILVPSIGMAHRQAEDARCRARVAELGAGCNHYYTDYNYYPGQAYPHKLLGSTPDPSDPQQFTGTQVLGACLFNYAYTVIGGATPPAAAEAKYAPLKSDDLQTLNTTSPRANSLSDRTSNPRAILYFPARAGVSGPGQYVLNDNLAYYDAPGDRMLPATFPNPLIVNPTLGGPYAPGQFIIFAAGLDRLYGTGDDIHYPPW